MSATAAPYGLQPAFKAGGTPASIVQANTIVTGYGTSILQFAPVKIGTSGGLELAAAGEAFVGTFMGVEYTETATGRRVYSNKWTASTAATEIVAYYTVDPYITYQIQADGAVSLSDLGGQSDTTTATSGSTTTGLSSVALSASGIVQTGEFKQLRIVGLAPVVGNAWGDAYTDVLVQISDHQYVAGRNAF